MSGTVPAGATTPDQNVMMKSASAFAHGRNVGQLRMPLALVTASAFSFPSRMSE